MDLDTPPTPPAEQQPPLPEQPVPPVRRSSWHTYRLPVIAFGVVVAASIGFAVLANRHAAQTAKTTSSSHTPPITSSTASQTTAENHWKSTVDPTALPLGDGKTATAPQVGYIDSCTTAFRGGGARHAGNWINTSNATWNSKTKVAVQGSVHWPAAAYSTTTSGSNRVLTTNDLPETYPTGTFPIGRSDPAYQYDTNPNGISAQTLTYTLPLSPLVAASPNCLPLGAIGILNDGVVIFDALDDGGRDARFVRWPPQRPRNVPLPQRTLVYSRCSQ